MTEVQLKVENKMGIHARPASLFVQKAKSFQSKIQLAFNGKSVDAKSILAVMTLGAKNGAEVTITADGPDEAEAIAEIKELIESRFGEE
ncbi:MAG: HPr family phosphocarrier protein [Selenomonadaceae bacterium]